MIERYENPKISHVFSDENKTNLWQDLELAAIKALVQLERVDPRIYYEIQEIWLSHPIDIPWWKERDEEIHHDLNAFLDERYRWLPIELHQFVHQDLTSFDTEETPFIIMLKQALQIIQDLSIELDRTIKALAIKYRYTIMNGRTHGQEAELQSFGARCLAWCQDVNVALNFLSQAEANLKYSKLSGAIGKYGSIDPEVEKITLEYFDLLPFYGATQIMPRIFYAPIAQALSNLVTVIDKVSTDIRLAARSGLPLMQEPFKKKQKGSSAMPHKKNPIRTEQDEGMARLARGYMSMTNENIKTWEERAIEQSCVERVAWPDLFHTTARALTVLNMVLKGLRVYPDNMLEEVHRSRGVYASSEIKEFLKKRLKLDNEDVYRIVQLAAFNVFEPEPGRITIREQIPNSFEESLTLLNRFKASPATKIVSLADFIPAAQLRFNDELDITPEQIEKYNKYLKKLFQSESIKQSWAELFTPAFLLKNEKILYQNILGV